MSAPVERAYFDAKFDGLEKLMTSQMSNLHDHIVAVSANGKATETDLQEHKDSTEAHGRKAADGAMSKVIAWLGFALAAGVAMFESVQHRR